MDEGKSAMEVTLNCRDEDRVVCYDEAGALVCAGAWYSDKVMDFMLDPPRSRFRAGRTDGWTVKVRRMRPDENHA